MKKQPVDNIIWVPRDKCKPNFWNPNHVAPPEMDLIKTSILANGWYFPIIVNAEFMIMDGFHRWTLSADPEIMAMTDGLIPVTVLEGLTLNESMILTIRANRAKGTHGVLKMADIVRKLQENGMFSDEIEKELGMEDEEVIRLTDRAGMPERRTRDFKDKGFNQSWVPDRE